MTTGNKTKAAAPRDDAWLTDALAACPSPMALLRRAAAQWPDKDALVYLRDVEDPAPVRLSYAELLRQVEAAAGAFRALGVGPAHSVAILLPPAPEAAVALIAASEAGVAFPMNLLLSSDALATQLQLARTRVVATLGAHPALDIRDRVGAALQRAGLDAEIVEINPGAGVDWAALAAARPAAADTLPRSEQAVAAYFHTGGTAGAPKLAQLSARNLAAGALMVAAASGWRHEDRLLSGMPLFHVGGAIDVLLAAFAVGATVIYPTASGFRNPQVIQRIWTLAERTGATIIGGVPTSLSAIAQIDVGEIRLERLRCIVTGGAALPVSLANRLASHCGRPIHQIYGMTETSGVISAHATDGEFRPATVGGAVPLVEIAIGAPSRARQAGVRGEIFCAGPNLFQGYLTPAGTVGRPDNGWLATGDLGELDASGELRIVGRVKDVIIRSGHNIDPALIEEAAVSHGDVAQAAAVGMPDAYAGELPVVFVVLRQGAAATAADIAGHIEANIAEPPARPQHVFIVAELPVTPLGKVTRVRLRQVATEFAVRTVLGLEASAEVACVDPAARIVRINAASAPPAASIEKTLSELGLSVEVA